MSTNVWASRSGLVESYYAYSARRSPLQVTHVAGLDELSEGRAPPAPGAVVDKVDRVGDEWSVVSVELARLVGSTVVVRVTDRRQRAVGHAADTAIHLERARHFVDHPFSTALMPFPA